MVTLDPRQTLLAKQDFHELCGRVSENRMPKGGNVQRTFPVGPGKYVTQYTFSGSHRVEAGRTKTPPAEETDFNVSLLSVLNWIELG